MIADRDPGAFGELVRRHQSQVRNFLRRLARNETVADDLAQDCFLHVWDKIHTYSARGSFIGWVLKVAYTTFLQSQRKSKRYRQILEESVHNDRGREDSPDYVAESESDLDRLMSVLNEQERVIMIYSYACGLSHREISDASGLPAGTVKSIIHRAKAKIRTHFEIEYHQHG